MPPTYDVHTHVGLDEGFYLRGWWPYAATVQNLLHHMDATGIDRAVCFPFTLPSAFDACAFADEQRLRLREGRFPFDRENTLLVQEVRRLDLKGRLLPLAMFDPTRCVPEQLAALEPLVGQIAGLKSQMTTIESPIRGLLDEGIGLIRFAEAHNLPVLLHTSVHPDDPWSQVADCLVVAERFPRIRFNLAHSLRFDVDGLRRAAELPNVWVDCSAHLAHCQLAAAGPSPLIAPMDRRPKTDYTRPAEALEAIEAMLPRRYMWGSDNPYMSWCDDRIRLINTYADEAAVLHALPESVQQRMTSEAPQGWLFGTRGERA